MQAVLSMICVDDGSVTQAEFKFPDRDAAEAYFSGAYEDAMKPLGNGWQAKYKLFGHRYADVVTLS